MTTEVTITFDGATYDHEAKILSELLKALHMATTPLVDSELCTVEAVGEVQFHEDDKRAVEQAFRYHGLKIPETSYPIPDTDCRFYYIDYECGDIVESVWSHVPDQFSHVPFRPDRVRKYGFVPGTEQRHSDNVAGHWDGTFDIHCSNADPQLKIDGKAFSARNIRGDGQFELYREYGVGYRVKVRDMKGEAYAAGEPDTWSGRGVRFELRAEDISEYLSEKEPSAGDLPF